MAEPDPSPAAEDSSTGEISGGEGSESRGQAARVARVIDGDTIELRNGERVRLVQIDAPESRGECYGAKAGQVLRGLLPAGTRITLQSDPALDDVDRYDRLLRYVFKKRTNINLVLVRRGAASVWFFQGERGRHADRLLAAAREARKQKRGAWGACRATLTPDRAFETAAKPKPKPKPKPPVSSGGQTSNCHPSYVGACLDPNVSDYDCLGGSGNGPGYTGTVRVVGPDEYGLDGDGDGIGCE